MTGWRSFAWTVLEPVSPLFQVTPVFAGQSPIGGRISAFSPVAPADPESGEPALDETQTALTPDSTGMNTSHGEGEETQLFIADVTEVVGGAPVNGGTVTFTVTGDAFSDTFVADLVEGQAFMDVGCDTESAYGDVQVPTGFFTIDADYSGSETHAPSSEPVSSELTCFPD
jgi:hypothetical protein